MNNIAKLERMIERIQTQEGDSFNYDLPSISQEYRDKEENQSNLSIKILSVFGGFLATLFFLACLGISGLFESEAVLLVFGIGSIIAGIAMNKIDLLIMDTFSLSLFISGFALMAFGLVESGVNESLVACIVILISLASLFFTQNFMLSFVAVINIGASFIFLINSNGLYNFIHLYIGINALLLSYCMLTEAKWMAAIPKISKLYNPVRIGLIGTLLFGLIVVGKRYLIPVAQNYTWLSSIALIIAILFVVQKIIPLMQITALKNNWLVLACCAILLIPSIFAPAILGAILILLLCFFVNYRTGFVIGIVALIYFIAQYYYDLNFTLLTKSIILFVSGVLFLLFYFTISKVLASNE